MSPDHCVEQVDHAFRTGSHGVLSVAGIRQHDFTCVMTSGQPNDSVSEVPDVAYLIHTRAGEWRDVFRLNAARDNTIGRSASNRVVLADDSCSRNHFRISQIGDGWVLQDLNSHNGTFVNGERVSADCQLKFGNVIRAGSSTLVFTDDLSTPLPATGNRPEGLETSTHDIDLRTVNPADEEPSILLSCSESKYHEPGEHSGDQTSQALMRLYRLGLDMGTSPDEKALSSVVINALTSATGADICAILLYPNFHDSGFRPSDLRIAAYTSDDDQPYHRVSDRLSEKVIESREAVLASDVADNTQLASIESLGELASVICAPIRHQGFVLGLIHLYASSSENQLSSDDLQFTLAVADQMGVALINLVERSKLANVLERTQSENQSLRQHLEVSSDLVGNSPAMQDLRARISLIASTDATVLVLGESGVGKELVARSLHFSSPRSSKPLICLNCAALSESLLESELFGHEKGAFTGATSKKIGKFEQAHEGSLFLDEVGEMSLPIQAKFLRVLEGHPFERVGGRESVRVDVRTIAATNRDLETAVEAGGFRSDLYFRLHVAEINVPALRQHPSDIPVLANYFLKRLVAKTGRPITSFSRDAIDLLTRYAWPGNIRELQNTIERTVILCTNEVVQPSDIQLSGLQPKQAKDPPAGTPVEYREQSLSEVEREHILQTLENMDWNKSQAAQVLGIERSTLDRKLKRYHVTRPD